MSSLGGDEENNGSVLKQDLAPVQIQGMLRWGALGCALVVLWLATRHYFGVIQDARFYTLEALRGLHPHAFADDMYFTHGSQGSYSLFSHLYRPFLSWFGVGAAGMAFTLAGQLCWIYGLYRLARGWVGKRFLWLSLATAIVMPNAYAFFGYGEDFATPRLFAEALTLLGLAFLHNRPPLSFVLLGLAAALHPLMALPGLAVAFVYFALARPLLWIALPAGAATAWLLGAAGVAPFADLLKTIDPAWFSIIQLRAAQCLLTTWTRESYFQILGVFVWAGLAWFVASGRERRFLAAVIAVGAAGLAVALVGGDILRNVLIVELQPWRSLWLLQLVSRIFIPVTFARLFAKSALVAERKADPFALAAALTMAVILVSATTRLIRLPYAAEFSSYSLLMVTPALAVILVQMILAEEKHHWIHVASLCTAIALVPATAWDWDQRTPWTKFLESSAPPPRELAALIPAKGSLYWEGGPEMPWLKLQRSSYFSCDQGTGVVFHRETAMTYKHRLDSFWPLRLGERGRQDDCRNSGMTQKPDRSRAGLENVCKREGGLDTLVLMAPVPGVPSRVWKSPVQFQNVYLLDGKIAGQSTDRFYVYSCGDFR
jgi:hypothetical protein